MILRIDLTLVPKGDQIAHQMLAIFIQITLVLKFNIITTKKLLLFLALSSKMNDIGIYNIGIYNIGIYNNVIII